MKLDNIGIVLGTNKVEIDPIKVTKKFKKFALSMLWGFLERKPYFSAQERYNREKRLIIKFSDTQDLSTPTLIAFSDEELTLIFETLDLTSLVQIFQNPQVHIDEKLQYLQNAFSQLHTIHNTGETHGDPYLKNFFRINGAQNSNLLYICDFEYERKSPDPAVTDILILTANSINSLSQIKKNSLEPTLSIVRGTYGGNIYFPFDIRDRIFFTIRFGMGKNFFQHFSNKKQIFC